MRIDGKAVVSLFAGMVIIAVPWCIGIYTIVRWVF